MRVQRLGDSVGDPNPDLGTHMNEIEGRCIFGDECGVRCVPALGRVLPCPCVGYDRGATWKKENQIKRERYLHDWPELMIFVLIRNPAGPSTPASRVAE